MNFEIIAETFPDYLRGALVTVVLLLGSLIIGLFLSFVVATMRLSKKRWLSLPAWSFIYFFRGTPLLVQMYMIYYGLPQFSLFRETFLWTFFQLPSFCALLALSLNNAGYTAAIIFNGVKATDRGEVEAGRAYGMKTWQLMRFIILPSAIRRSIPAYSNEIIFMLHATALVSLITIADITGVARKIYTRFYTPFEAFIIAALFYLALTILITALARKIEKKLTVFRGKDYSLQ